MKYDTECRTFEEALERCIEILNDPAMVEYHEDAQGCKESLEFFIAGKGIPLEEVFPDNGAQR